MPNVAQADTELAVILLLNLPSAETAGWWCTPVTAVLVRLRQEKCSEVEAGPGMHPELKASPHCMVKLCLTKVNK